MIGRDKIPFRFKLSSFNKIFVLFILTSLSSNFNFFLNLRSCFWFFCSSEVKISFIFIYVTQSFELLDRLYFFV